MLKKILLSGIVSLSIVTSVAAQNELINEMNTLTGSLYEVQRGFLTNDMDSALKSLDTFEKDVSAYLGDETAIKRLLPKKLKHKSNIAINSANMIGKHIQDIRVILKDKDLPMISRQMSSQKAFMEIQYQCFRCHNLVRDWQ
jgi:hypothetical protein